MEGSSVATVWDDTWNLEQGLDDDFDWYITNAAFVKDPDYKADVFVLRMDGYSPDPDVSTTKILWSLGEGWVSYDGGRTVTHEQGRKTFVATSIMGRLLRRVRQIAEQESPQLAQILASRKATDASIWVGLGFHFRREEMKFGRGFREGEEPTHLMPVRFLGVFQVGQPAQGGVAAPATPPPVPTPNPVPSAPAPAPAPAAPSPTPVQAIPAQAAPAGPGQAVSAGDLRAQLIAYARQMIAQGISDEREFRKWATSGPLSQQVLFNTTLMTELVNGTLWQEALKG